MAWRIDLAASAVIAAAYFCIFAVIFRGLLRSGQVRSNHLGTATAAIFFSCGMGHMLHVDHLIAPSLGLADAQEMRGGIDWHLAAWDALTAVVAVTYFTLRKSYGRLLEGGEIFGDPERRAAQRRVHDAERLFRTSFENAPIGMALVAPDGRFLQVNRALCAMVGHEEAALLARSFQQITHPDDIEADLALFGRLVDGEIGEYELEKRYLHAAGHEVWAQLQVSIVRDEDGAPQHLIAQIRDVTTDRAAEAELRRFRAVVEQAQDAIYAVDLHDRFVTWNRGAERLYGYSREEAIGRSRAIILPPDRVGEMATTFAEAAAGRSVGDMDTVRRRRDGSLVEVQVNVSPVRDASGAIVGVSTIARDISERAAADRAREALQRDLARARDHYAGVLSAATSTAIIGTDAWGVITVFNSGAELLLGHRAADVVGRERLDLILDRAEITARAHALGMVDGFEAFVAEARGGDCEAGEWTYVRRDGGRRRMSVSVTAQHDETGQVTGFLTIATDITEARRAAELFRGAFEHAPIGVALSTAQGPEGDVLARVNHALAELVGRDVAELEGRTLGSLVHEEDRPALADALGRLRAGSERVRVEQRLRHADGRDVWALLSSSVVRLPGDEAPQVITQVLDISASKTFEVRLQHLADHDGLTSLHNRRRFEQELARALSHAERYGSHGAVLLLDLDGFKDVNDTLGHSVGDELITRVGAALRGTLRATDQLARLGGDEFAVILPEADESEAIAVAEKLASAVRRQGTVTTAERQARVTTSIGITLFDGACGLTSEDLLVEADIAMYDVKDAGRDGVKVFRSAERRRERISVRATWLERLRAAFEEDRFRLLAQPIRSLSADGAPWHELLLRFEDEQGDLVPPGVFLYIAERFDLVCEIDRWVLGRAVEMLHAEHSAGRPGRLAVNLSGKTLSDPGLADHLEGLISRRPIPEGSLVIEVTETAAIVNIERAGALADRLHALGCRFALDDFGAGFASFYYLKHLHFDYVKIDGEFVHHLVGNATDQLVIQAVVDIARGMGTETVAEFVGDDETVQLLRRLGVDYGQGFHLGRPAPLVDAVPSATR